MRRVEEMGIPNRVLAALPRKNYQRIAADLEPVSLVFGQDLYKAGDTIRQVYFPNDCVVSMINMVGPDQGAEVGLVGNEGMVGIPIALGVNFSPLRAVVQGTGTAMRMSAPLFRRAVNQDAALQRELFRFTHLMMSQVAQTAACNQFHSVNQRLARWLLMTRDRVKLNEFRLTQEFLAKMLGVQRSAVNIAASGLQRLGCISYSRGVIVILDQRRLQTAACGCYGSVKKLYEQAYT